MIPYTVRKIGTMYFKPVLQPWKQNSDIRLEKCQINTYIFAFPSYLDSRMPWVQLLFNWHTDSLMHDCSISIANSLEILQSCSISHRYFPGNSGRIDGRETWWRHQMETFPALLLAICGPVNSLYKGGALMYSLICAWIYGWVNNREVGELRRYCAHYDVTLMEMKIIIIPNEIINI